MLVLMVLTVTVFSSIVTYGNIVETSNGPVDGDTVNVTTFDGRIVGINTWLGIPFARAPVGNLRWMPPLKPERWSGTRPAKEFGNACPQGPTLIWATNYFFEKFDEDCLNLCVYSPEATPPAEGFPVLFWIHGGGYSGSANVQYPGHFIATKETVVVTINYRLGFLGFMSTDDQTAPGNYGMLDQVMALEWVRDNIANFGGNPNLVTLYGQSAGGSSASLHILSKRSTGLFHQVIAESGSDLTPWAINYPQMEPSWYTYEMARSYNELFPDETPIPLNNSRDMIEVMRRIDYDDLDEANGEVPRKPGWISLGFSPVVDGPYRSRDEAFLEDTPFNLRDREDFNRDINIISGLTSEDGSLYVIAVLPESLERGFNRSEFRERLAMLSYELTYDDVWEDAYQAILYEFSPWPHVDDLDANRQKFNEMFTDVGFAWGMDLQLKSHVKYHNNTYEYVLGMRSTNATAAGIPEWMGVPHNGELPYVWGWPWLKFNPAVRNQTGMTSSLVEIDGREDIVDWNAEDAEYADFVMTLWANFARTGDPTPEPVRGIKWNPWNTETREYISLFRNVSIEDHYRVHELAFWQEYAPYIVNKTNESWETTTRGPDMTRTTQGVTMAPGGGVSAGQISEERDRYRRATIALGVIAGVFLVVSLLLVAALLVTRSRVSKELD